MSRPLGSVRSGDDKDAVEARNIMRSSIFVPFPKLLERPAQNDRERLELRLRGLSDHDEQIRANIKNQFYNKHPPRPNSNANTRPPTKQVDGTNDDASKAARIEAENIALIQTLNTPYDPASGDPAQKPRPNPSSQAVDPALQKLLDAYDRHAINVRKGYERRLAELRPPSRPPSRPGTASSVSNPPGISNQPAAPVVTQDPRLARRLGAPPSLKLKSTTSPLESGEITPATPRSASAVTAPGTFSTPSSANAVPLRGSRSGPPLHSSLATPNVSATSNQPLPARPASAGVKAPDKPIWAQPIKRKASTELPRLNSSPKRKASTPNGPRAERARSASAGRGKRSTPAAMDRRDSKGGFESGQAASAGRGTGPMRSPVDRRDGRGSRGGPWSPSEARPGRNSWRASDGGRDRGDRGERDDPYMDPRRYRLIHGRNASEED